MLKVIDNIGAGSGFAEFVERFQNSGLAVFSTGERGSRRH